MQQKYRIRFFFDYGSGTCFWSGNEQARARFGYAIAPAELPLSLATLKKVKDLLERYDHSLNWDYPPDPGLWRQEECDRFNDSVNKLFEIITRELAEDFELSNEQIDLGEDPDLDEYLKNPQEFEQNRNLSIL